MRRRFLLPVLAVVQALQAAELVVQEQMLVD
jgi:hypothetical protein